MVVVTAAAVVVVGMIGFAVILPEGR
jgi:hypothetical protein